jgi:hypothetical protein
VIRVCRLSCQRPSTFAFLRTLFQAVLRVVTGRGDHLESAFQKGRYRYGRRKDGTEFPVEISLGQLETAGHTCLWRRNSRRFIDGSCQVRISSRNINVE